MPTPCPSTVSAGPRPWRLWLVCTALLTVASPAWGQDDGEVPPELEDVLGAGDLGPVPRRPVRPAEVPPSAASGDAPAGATATADPAPANGQAVAQPQGPQGEAEKGNATDEDGERADATAEAMRDLSASLRSEAPGAGGPGNADLLEELVRANALVDAGRLARALAIYERVVREGGERYPLASFNLGQLLAYRGECEQAVLHFGAYLALGDQEEVRAEARQAIADCQSEEPWPLLHLHGMPAATRVQVNGYAVARGLGELELRLAPGTYRVELNSADYLPRQIEVTLGAEARVEVAAEMILRTFYGRLTVETSSNAGVEVQVTPLAFDSPRDHVKPFGRPAPFGQAVELPTGRYHVRITHPDFHPWVRNVRIDRDQETRVEARLEKLLPPEIRQ